MDNRNKNVRIWYLSGGMTKFGKEEFEKSNSWRTDIKEQIEKMSEGYITAFNPNEHYSMLSDPEDYSDREVMNLDIYKLRQSELVIYNNNDPLSCGSMIELGIAWEKRIPIFVLNEDRYNIHPWVQCFAECVFCDREDMMKYLNEHYIWRD